METMNIETELTQEGKTSVARLSRDLVKATKDGKGGSGSSGVMTADEARFLVDAYYTMQEDRIRSGNQVQALGSETEFGTGEQKNPEPNSVLAWLEEQSRVLENQIKRALDNYSNSQPLGCWAREVIGIGPVIAAGLLAHIDIAKAPTVGHIWRYAGLDPTSEWKKGEKRPWNSRLKTLCWKIGESFVKVSGNPDAFYGQIYKQRKEWETAKNIAGDYKSQAAAKLEKFKIGKQTEAYKHYSEGHLPPAHIHARAKRYAVKLFLAHYHEQGYILLHNQKPPLPYPIAILGHAHKIEANV